MSIERRVGPVVSPSTPSLCLSLLEPTRWVFVLSAGCSQDGAQQDSEDSADPDLNERWWNLTAPFICDRNSDQDQVDQASLSRLVWDPTWGPTQWSGTQLVSNWEYWQCWKKYMKPVIPHSRNTLNVLFHIFAESEEWRRTHQHNVL